MTHILEGKRVKRTDWQIQGEGPDPLSDLMLVWNWNSYIDRIIYHFLTGWFFLMKHRLHFATKLNPRAIQKCNCFWVSSWSVCLCSQSSISCTDCERCSQIEKHVVVSAFSAGHKKVQQSSEPTFGPPQPKVPGSAPVNPYLYFRGLSSLVFICFTLWHVEKFLVSNHVTTRPA